MPHQAKTAHPLTIALAGMLALAVAMGIGRFAFTPLMPMMLHDQQIDLPQASWLASANYLVQFCARYSPPSGHAGVCSH